MAQHEEAPAHDGEQHVRQHVRHPAKMKHHVEVPAVNDDFAAPDEAPEVPEFHAPLLADAVPVQNTVASVGVPTTATDELSKLIPANGQISGLTVVLAAVAVLGGGAAWKFYSQRSKEKHEEKLREMELQASQPQTQHPSCKAENEAIQGELKKLHEAVASMSSSVSDASQRLAKLESKVESPDLPEGMDYLEDRIKKLERAIKPPRGKAKT